MTKQTILNIIKERMKKRNLSEYELERISGISRSTLNRNLKNETEMTLSTFLKIIETLGIDLKEVHGYYKKR